jgi:nucleoside-diphosphate-sugar epimerase
MGWEPTITLEDGLKKTFDWIYGEILGKRDGK